MFYFKKNILDESQALERYHLQLCMQIGKQKVKMGQKGKLLLPSSCSISTNHWASY
jgi:hypothetical protein